MDGTNGSLTDRVENVTPDDDSSATALACTVRYNTMAVCNKAMLRTPPPTRRPPPPLHANMYLRMKYVTCRKDQIPMSQ